MIDLVVLVINLDWRRRSKYQQQVQRKATSRSKSLHWIMLDVLREVRREIITYPCVYVHVRASLRHHDRLSIARQRQTTDLRIIVILDTRRYRDCARFRRSQLHTYDMDSPTCAKKKNKKEKEKYIEIGLKKENGDK